MSESKGIMILSQWPEVDTTPKKSHFTKQTSEEKNRLNSISSLSAASRLPCCHYCSLTKVPQPSNTYLLLLFAFHLYRQSASAVIRRMKCEYIPKVIKKRSPYISHIEVRIVRQHDGKIDKNVIFLNKIMIKDRKHFNYDIEHYVFIGFIVCYLFSQAFHTFVWIL